VSVRNAASDTAEDEVAKTQTALWIVAAGQVAPAPTTSRADTASVTVLLMSVTDLIAPLGALVAQRVESLRKMARVESMGTGDENVAVKVVATSFTQSLMPKSRRPEVRVMVMVELLKLTLA
jgi:hypothetical protein